MPTFLTLSALLLSSLLSAGQDSQSQRTADPPTLPVVDSGACPFEGCTFGKWTVTRSTALYSSWKPDRAQIGQLHKGEVVTSVTGIHLTKQPDRIQVIRAIPELRLKPGDTVLRYMYVGEGFANIWANGKYLKEVDCTFVTEKNGDGCLRDCGAVVEKQGVKEWWVQVKSSSGKTGWALVDGNFDGMDALATASSERKPGN
jgi:hypothetical protein